MRGCWGPRGAFGGRKGLPSKRRGRCFGGVCGIYLSYWWGVWCVRLGCGMACGEVSLGRANRMWMRRWSSRRRGRCELCKICWILKCTNTIQCYHDNLGSLPTDIGVHSLLRDVSGVFFKVSGTFIIHYSLLFLCTIIEFL